MTDRFSNTEAEPRHRAYAWLLFPLAFFPLAALLTYDWMSISALCCPPRPHTNWIGALGDGFAYYGYLTFGLAIWLVPAMCIVAGLCFGFGRRVRLIRRGIWFTVFQDCFHRDLLEQNLLDLQTSLPHILFGIESNFY